MGVVSQQLLIGYSGTGCSWSASGGSRRGRGEKAGDVQLGLFVEGTEVVEALPVPQVMASAFLKFVKFNIT
jgi:hypothetical protein